MRRIRMRIGQGISLLLIVQTVVFALVSIIFINSIYNVYLGLVYDKSEELVRQYARSFEDRLGDIRELSVEFLSNADIQRNLTAYAQDPRALSATVALGELYTQMFTRAFRNENIGFISFEFLDGKRVEVAGSGRIPPDEESYARVLEQAKTSDGRHGWAVEETYEDTLILYRLIKNTSAYGFPDIGVLMVGVDISRLLRGALETREEFTPELFCVAGGHLFSSDGLEVPLADIKDFLSQNRAYGSLTVAGQRYFASASRTREERWELVYVQSRSQVLSGLVDMNLTYVLSLVLFGAVMLLGGMTLASSITRPLSRLSGKMKEVEQGNYKVPPGGFLPKKSPAASEVRELADSYEAMLKKIDNLINEVYYEKLSHMEIKYKMLQQHINPHFLYNTLDTINWKAIASGDRDVSLMVRSLSGMLRFSIAGPDIITLREELKFLDGYLSIQKIRFENRLAFSADVPEEALSCPIPKLTIQPVVENCISHNLEKHSGVCEVRLTAVLHDDMVELMIDDNGTGADLAEIALILQGKKPVDSTGIGLRNIQERLRIAFGDGFTLKVENLIPNGTRVRILLPRKESAIL